MMPKHENKSRFFMHFHRKCKLLKLGQVFWIFVRNYFLWKFCCCICLKLVWNEISRFFVWKKNVFRHLTLIFCIYQASQLQLTCFLEYCKSKNIRLSKFQNLVFACSLEKESVSSPVRAFFKNFCYPLLKHMLYLTLSTHRKLYLT